MGYSGKQSIHSFGLMFCAAVLGSVLTLLVSATISVSAQTGQRIVSAEEFRLVSSGGGVLAKLGVEDDKVLLTMANQLGTEMIRLAVTDDGTAVLGMSSSTGDNRILLGVDGSDSLPLVEFKDGDGRTRLGSYIHADNRVTLALLDKAGTSGIVLSSDQNGNTGLSFVDLKGRERINVGTKADGTAALKFVGDNGKPQAAILNTDNTSAMVITDADAKPIWSAPAQ